MDLERITARAAEVSKREGEAWLANTTASKALHERALKSLPNGVTSNFQVGDPYPVYLEKGKGSSVWDVDGTEYKDFHGGFGVNIVGHAHPKIVEAITKQASTLIHVSNWYCIDKQAELARVGVDHPVRQPCAGGGLPVLGGDQHLLLGLHARQLRLGLAGGILAAAARAGTLIFVLDA